MNGSGSSVPTTMADLEPALYHGLSVQMIAISSAVIGIWMLRFAFHRSKAYYDARAVLITFCILNKTALVAHLHNLARHCRIHWSSIAGSLALAIVSWWIWRMPWKKCSISSSSNGFDDTVLMPLMIPCRTTHSRLFPAKHSFSYSYLLAGIPIGWRGHAGGMLSADCGVSKWQIGKTWFHIAADDYLERGFHKQGLVGKLRDYLASHMVEPNKYPYAYLVTAPRFLGFSFNPVSFWYLYDIKRSLAAMILEVNNTFDERRIYFMERRVDSDEPGEQGRKFVQEWPKDFHVSPFNDRGGAYSVQSIDPFHTSQKGQHQVDNNIVLKSEDGKPKIIARVFSTEPAIDIRKLTSWEIICFVLRWWWVGFMTNPRILKEAKMLWTKNLQVYYRPEVLSSSIGRKETPDEVQLETFFKDLLDRTVAVTHGIIHYTAAAGLSRAKQTTIHSTLACEEDTHKPEIEVRILTPAFYSQLVRSRTLLEAFDRYCFQAASGEAMVHCTHPMELRDALTRFSTSLRPAADLTVDEHIVANSDQNSILQSVRQTLLMFVRSSGQSETRCCLSDFDVHALRNSYRLEVACYCSIALKILLADRLAFGWLPLLKLEETLIWSLLVLVAASAAGELLGSNSQCSGQAILTLLKFCAIHAWSASIP